MNTTHATQVHQGTTLRVGEWLLAIFGGIAAFLGGFVLLAQDSSTVSIGLGGDWSWTVAELGDGWGYGLLAGGVVALVAAWALLRYDRREGYPHETSPTGAFIGHATAFVLVNALLWAQDLALGDGLSYAYWVTIAWGAALLAHAYATFAQRGHSPPTG
jgi:hypothetical protein